MPGSPTDAGGDGPVAVSADDYLWFVDRALGQMARIVEELGDDMCNRRPPFRDANSPYVILSHCLGVMEYWGGATVAERAVRRDPAAEFTAHGDVAGLLRRVEQARRRLREDLVGLEVAAEPVNVWRDPADPVPYTETKGAALVHILEELFQHLGQMEITRDALVAANRR
ncbi:MAG TPA: DinB family protein [Acidimicrobiales bacterium]|nr:DinB family protein [Acidimicrobiales bacterium]